MYLKQSTAATIMFGPFVDKADGVTLKTDATTITDIDHASTGIFLSKNGGTAAIRHATVTASVADAYGMMKVTLDTTDTNTLGRLDVLFAKAATYLPVHARFIVLPANVYDSLISGSASDYLQVDVVQSGGSAAAAGAIPNAAAGAAGGLFIAGTNAATTITTAGGTALTISSTGANGHGIDIAGNGTGDGIKTVAGATGNGLNVQGGATSGYGLRAYGPISRGAYFFSGGTGAEGVWIGGAGTAAGLHVQGGATGPGVEIVGGATSGFGITVATTDGDGVSVVAAGAGHTDIVGKLAALTVDTLADSYAAHEAQPTIGQAILGILQYLTERSVSTTTVTVKKPDGSTTALTLTLDSATDPTSITRAT